MWRKLPKWLKNKYAITLLVFIIWLLFFDQNNIISQISYIRQLRKLKREKAYFAKEIVKSKADLKDLTTNDKALEKFARENYYMKKPDEDVFVIVPQKTAKK